MPVNEQLRRLSVCVVNYNGEGYLPACLAAIRTSCRDPLEIIVVDDASTDASVELLKRDFPEVVLIESPENRGPGAARNAAYAKAEGDYVLFIDNDVRVISECISTLLEALLRHPGAAVAMPRVCYASRPDTIQYDGAGCHPVGLMTLHHRNQPVAGAGDTVRFIRSVVTACIMIDKSELGMDAPFDESFFFNYEDHDFGFRCSLTGRAMISVPTALCLHGSGTEGLSYRDGGTYSDRRLYLLIRNRWQILLKDYRLSTLFVLAPILLLFEVFQFGGVLVRGRVSQWFKAAWWIVTHVPDLLRRRRVVQAARVIGDLELFSIEPLPLTDEMRGGGFARVAVDLLDKAILAYMRLIRPADRGDRGNHDENRASRKRARSAGRD